MLEHFSLLTVDGAAEQITTNISQGAQGAQCVDILGIHLSEGSRVQQWQCSGGNSNGMFKLKGTDLCIDVPNGSVKSGEALQVYTCNPDNINQ
eukprot:gene25935-31748_t